MDIKITGLDQLQLKIERTIRHPPGRELKDVSTRKGQDVTMTRLDWVDEQLQKIESDYLKEF